MSGAVDAEIKKLPANRTRHILSRSTISNDLDGWFLSKDRPIATVVAPGGLGKTTAVREWLLHSSMLGRELNAHPSVTLLVHSFYGQTDTDQSVVDIAIDSLYRAIVIGSGEVPFSTATRIAKIVQECERKKWLIVLDGLETQQDPDGYVAARSLPMDDLIAKLASTNKCKILITTRIPLNLFDRLAVEQLDVPQLLPVQVYEMLKNGVVDIAEGQADAFTAQFFSMGAIPLVVSVFVDILNAWEGTDYDALVDQLLRGVSFPERPLKEVCGVLMDHLPRDVALVMGGIAISDTPLSPELLRDFLAPADVAFADGISGFGGLAIAIEQENLWDLHPRIKEAVVEVLEIREPGFIQGFRMALAGHLESAASSAVNRQIELSLLFRALSFWLRANELDRGIKDVYLGKISGESDASKLRSNPRWRSIREDFSYRFEVSALAEIIASIDRAKSSDWENYKADAQYRQVLVQRAMGLIDDSDRVARVLAYRESSEIVDSGTTGQIALTQLIKGNVVGRPNDPYGAKYWCDQARKLAEKIIAIKGDHFPMVRAAVYTGAYHHRMAEFGPALNQFKSAVDLQADIHDRNAKAPPCLMGLNAYIYVWFLLESGRVSEAIQSVDDCRRFLKAAPTTNDPTFEQWNVMTDITEAWVRQEQALVLPVERRQDAYKSIRQARDLLTSLAEREDDRDFSIPFDIRSTYVRAQARQSAMFGEPSYALEILRRNANIYERRGARLYAADCQSDIVRILISEESLTINWLRPSIFELQAELDRLVKLTDRYPLGRMSCFDMPRLKAFDLP
jgi:hypothetical protein